MTRDIGIYTESKIKPFPEPHPKSELKRVVVFYGRIYWRSQLTEKEGSAFLCESCPVQRQIIASYQRCLYLDEAYELRKSAQGSDSLEMRNACNEQAVKAEKCAEEWRRWGLGKD